MFYINSQDNNVYTHEFNYINKKQKSIIYYLTIHILKFSIFLNFKF